MAKPSSTRSGFVYASPHAGAPGCTLADFHTGPHSSQLASGKRSSVARTPGLLAAVEKGGGSLPAAGGKRAAASSGAKGKGADAPADRKRARR